MSEILTRLRAFASKASTDPMHALLSERLRTHEAAALVEYVDALTAERDAAVARAESAAKERTVLAALVRNLEFHAEPCARSGASELQRGLLAMSIERARAIPADLTAALMPEPRLMRTVEDVEALPDGNYAYCFAQGKRLRGLATKRNRVWTFIGTDDECEPNSAEMVATWISGPLPDLPTPTAGETP